jgi:hypothetical protein
MEICPKCGGSKQSGYVQRLISENKLDPSKVSSPSKFIQAMKPKVTKKEVKEVLGRKHMTGYDMAQYDIAVQRRNRPTIKAYEDAYPGLKSRK